MKRSITQTTIEKGKHILHLILKKKPLTVKVIEEINDELEKRLTKFLDNIFIKIKDMKFDNPEQTLKVIIIKGLINILKKMIEENSIKLTEEDKKILDEIMIEDNNNNINIEENNEIKNDDNNINNFNSNDINNQNNLNNENNPQRSYSVQYGVPLPFANPVDPQNNLQGRPFIPHRPILPSNKTTKNDKINQKP